MRALVPGPDLSGRLRAMARVESLVTRDVDQPAHYSASTTLKPRSSNCGSTPVSIWCPYQVKIEPNRAKPTQRALAASHDFTLSWWCRGRESNPDALAGRGF